MVRTNLSTRPFYNERMVHLLLALAGVVVIVLTAFNAIQILALSRQNTEFSALINRDRAEAQRLNEEARRIRAGINQDELQATVQAADEANRLIDQRTFSWTEFFNRIENTLPPDVMLTAVQPSFAQNRSIIQMSVLGRRTEDVDAFIEKLEATGAFRDVLPAQQEETDEGLYQVLLRAEYRTTGDAPAPAAEAAPAGEPAPAADPPRETAPAGVKGAAR
jgi:Tfp pilus assembly protein PilN